VIKSQVAKSKHVNAPAIGTVQCDWHVLVEVPTTKALKAVTERHFVTHIPLTPLKGIA